MVWCSLRAASKDQIVSYDQETNAISETYSYIQDISDEVLHMKTMVYYITLWVADKLNISNSRHPYLTYHELHQLHDYSEIDRILRQSVLFSNLENKKTRQWM